MLLTARRVVLVLCALLLLALVACNSNDDDPDAVVAPTASGSLDACADIGAGAAPVVSSSVKPTTPEVTATTGSAARSALPLIEFQRQSGGSVCLPTEIVPETEFSIGLSGRYEFDDRGMLFYFGHSQMGAFWMKHTHVNLSIAFVDQDSTILNIEEMTAESLDNVFADGPYLYAIEAQPGWYTRNHVQAGDHVVFKFNLPPELTN